MLVTDDKKTNRETNTLLSNCKVKQTLKITISQDNNHQIKENDSFNRKQKVLGRPRSTE